MKRSRKILGGIIIFIILTACFTLGIKKITQDDIPILIGTWKGYLSKSIYKEEYHGGTAYQNPATLTIYNESLKGTLEIILPRKEKKNYPFFGKIENGRLVSHWKNGYMKLDLQIYGDEKRLVGFYEFPMANGSIYLVKE